MVSGKDVTSEIDKLFGADAPIVEVDPKARPSVRARQRKKIGKLPTLTLPERRLVNHMLDEDHPTITQASVRAGMHINTARKALKKPQVQDAFQRVLEEHGLNDSRLAEKVDSLLEARTTIFNKGEAVDVNDNRVQLEATKVLKDLLGHGQKSGGPEAAAGEQHVHLHLEAAGVSQGTIMVLDRVMRQIKNPDDSEPIDITPSES